MQRLPAAGLAVLLLSTLPAHTRDQTVILAVENMTCVTCPYIVKQSLISVPGVIRAEVSFQESDFRRYGGRSCGDHRGNHCGRLSVSTGLWRNG